MVNPRLARPYRNSGIAYIPKRKKPELTIQLQLAARIRRHFPTVIFHSDYAAGADLSKNQARINSDLQSKHKFPDMLILTPSRGYVAMALELKDDNTPVILKIGPDKGKLTKDPHVRAQAETLRQLNKQGWYANFGVGLEPSWKLICWYLQYEQTELF